MRILVVTAAAVALLGFTVAVQAQAGGQGGTGEGTANHGGTPGIHDTGMNNGGMKHKMSHKRMMMMKKDRMHTNNM
jgi:hypothetical protein